jgi:Esterase-like activity of phytase
MALSADGRTLYPSLEGALTADPNQNHRVVYAYDLVKGRFRSWTADYVTDAPGNAIGDLTAASRDVLLLIERDNLQGTEAATKRIYRLDIDQPNGRAIPKSLLIDLLHIANPDLLGGPPHPGTVGLGDPFAFPFQTIESVLVLDRRTGGRQRQQLPLFRRPPTRIPGRQRADPDPPFPPPPTRLVVTGRLAVAGHRAAGVFAWHQPAEAHERTRPSEAAPVGDLGGQVQGTQAGHAPVGAQAGHLLGERRPVEPDGQVGLDGLQLGVAARQHRR